MGWDISLRARTEYQRRIGLQCSDDEAEMAIQSLLREPLSRVAKDKLGRVHLQSRDGVVLIMQARTVVSIFRSRHTRRQLARHDRLTSRRGRHRRRH